MTKNRAVVLAIAILLCIAAVIFFMQRDEAIDTQAEALKQARDYKHGNCTTVVTPARHIKSGATYTFSSGCIPAGWEARYGQ